MDRAALIGKTTPGGWTIVSFRERGSRHTGGRHSYGYIATNDLGENAFVKALDMRLGAGKDDDIQMALKDLATRIDCFRYEWNLAEQCNGAGLSGVIRALEEGAFELEGEDNPVPFLVFELADCDLREQADREKRFDLAFRLRVLHKSAVGLSQLHGIRIALQDMKPSNIVVFENNSSKIADLGSAHHREIVRPGDSAHVAADRAYAPLEQLYGAVGNGWESRRLVADLYLLGSIAAFLVTGIGMTQHIKMQLGHEQLWTNFNDDYEQVLPYLREAMEAALDDIGDEADPEIADEIVRLIGYLCDPDPALRGHPRNVEGAGGHCGLERFVSRFDVMATRAEMAVARGARRERV